MTEEKLHWTDSDGISHTIPCDWNGCSAESVAYVRLDEYIGPYDKTTLCPAHRDAWKAGSAPDRQGNLVAERFW